jgi:hypothetical protein
LPFDYAPPDGAHLAVLHFGTLELDGKTAMKCDCDYRYALSEVLAALGRDGLSATRLGFHAQIVAWGL